MDIIDNNFFSRTHAAGNDRSTVGRFDPEVFVDCVQDSISCVRLKKLSTFYMLG